MNKTLLGCLALTLSMPTFAKTVINFETDATYPPFESVSDSGRIVGFDIDLASALCHQIGAQCYFHNVPFVSIVPSLEYGKYDAAISAMNITKARQQKVLFTDSYLPDEVGVVTKSNKLTQLKNLKGIPVAVQNGTTLQKYMQNKMPDIHMRSYPNYQNAMSDMDVGRVKAIFADMAVITTWIKANKALHLVGKPFTDSHYFGAGFGIAVNKNDIKLQEQLNKALAQIKSNGKYEKIYHHYFG
ncbi:transporter substrate-binding domain-containing protein [Vibrio sp. S4M6]|uniref:transporter substrate-binding domain-containing protein n=1 Tax=Vibrio sinus TaxID=2946865 RepID=UPI00202A8DE6|nr:transporter substrate-binding domain-containing protein [Vibrio sinus]MCL9780725.1 transporter substrate-binding domain-containing protein [Vibrio sinus]